MCIRMPFVSMKRCVISMSDLHARPALGATIRTLEGAFESSEGGDRRRRGESRQTEPERVLQARGGVGQSRGEIGHRPAALYGFTDGGSDFATWAARLDRCAWQSSHSTVACRA